MPKAPVDGEKPKPIGEPPKPAPKAEETPKPGELEQKPPANGEEAAQPPKPKGTFNPVKELKVERARAAQLEARLKELEGRITPDNDRTEWQKKLESTAARNKELEDAIRHVRYEKSTEFRDKYQAPYEQALGQAINVLGKIPVVDPATGQQRAANEEDLFELINADPVQQIELAETKFGKLAGKAISHAEKVSDLLASRNQALQEAQKNGAARESELQQRTQAQEKQVLDYTNKLFADTFKSYQEHPETGVFLKPIEIPDGQEATPEEAEYNEAVQKGISGVESAWKVRPDQAKTRAELDTILKQRVKFGARAAAFPALFLQNKRAQAKIKALEASLKQYEGTSPEAGGRQTGPTITSKNGRRDREAERLDRLRKMAR